MLPIYKELKAHLISCPADFKEWVKLVKMLVCKLEQEELQFLVMNYIDVKVPTWTGMVLHPCEVLLVCASEALHCT